MAVHSNSLVFVVLLFTSIFTNLCYKKTKLNKKPNILSNKWKRCRVINGTALQQISFKQRMAVLSCRRICSSSCLQGKKYSVVLAVHFKQSGAMNEQKWIQTLTRFQVFFYFFIFLLSLEILKCACIFVNIL